MRNVKEVIKRSGAFALLGAISISSAMAATPYSPDLVKGGNRWEITAYDDSSPVHNQWATQGICFVYAGTVGEHQRYRWYSDTFPDWNGIASQEGDTIIMHGDYANNVGHDGIEWDLVTASRRDEGYGHWTEWRENSGVGNTIGFANAKLKRVGYCQIQESETKYMEAPYDERGNLMTEPSGLGLKSFSTK